VGSPPLPRCETLKPKWSANFCASIQNEIAKQKRQRPIPKVSIPKVANFRALDDHGRSPPAIKADRERVYGVEAPGQFPPPATPEPPAP